MKSILVGIPYHPKKRYSLNHVFDWLDQQTYKNIEPIMRIHIGTFGEHDAVKNQREFFRILAVERGHDYFYSMGADTIPPLDALDRLVAHNKDVVGALYRQRKETDSPNVIAWQKKDPKQEFIKAGGLQKVDGMGMDAVLLSRKAFTSFTYKDWPTVDDDGPAYNALKGNGFDIWLDTEMICKHYMSTEQFV
jgi:hypothetical protein